MARILITGGKGMLGRTLQRELADHELFVADLPETDMLDTGSLGRAFAAFYLKDGRLIAADAVSRPQDFMFAKKLVAMAASVDPAQLADESVPLKNLVPA